MENNPWDPSIPGAGAQRVIAITQLYFRMCKYPQLTVLVVDAFISVFPCSGATLSELANYLGLAEPRVQFAIDSIPKQMICALTSLPRDHPHRLAQLEAGDSSDDEEAGSKGLGKKKEVHYFINYKNILPVAYAHACRMLLSCCMVPLPSTNSEPNHMSISAELKKTESKEGIYCVSCSLYFALADFESTISLCPTCKRDVVVDNLDLIKDSFKTQLKSGSHLVAVVPKAKKWLPFIDGARMRSEAQNAFKETLPVALAREPFLVQQAVVFLYLYRFPFACANESDFILDPEEILTEAEFERRVQGRSSIIDSFRALNRNPMSVHVQLRPGYVESELKRRENELKLQKRKQLPPWLRTDTVVTTDKRNTNSDVSKTKGQKGTVENNGRKRLRSETVRDHYQSLSSFITEKYLSDSFEPVALPKRKV